VELPKEGEIRISPGLQVTGDHVTSSKPGVVRQTKNGTLWVDGRQKRYSICVNLLAMQSVHLTCPLLLVRYIPAVDDRVIGVIVERHSEVRDDV
jgi:exosome complex RNA-binding protein Rrp4